MANAIVRYSGVLLLLNLIIIALVSYGAKNLYIETDYKIFFDKQDPNLAAEEKLKAIYGKSDNIVFVIDPDVDDVFNTATLKTIENLTKSAWQIPHSKRVDSISNYQHPSVDNDDITIESLIKNAQNYTKQDISHVKSIALKETGLVGRLVSESGNAASVHVTLNLPDEGTGIAISEAVKRAREIKETAEMANPTTSIYLAGIATTEQTLTEIAAKDAMTLIPIMFLIVLGLLWIMLRSFLATMCTLIIITISVMAGMGYAGWSGLALNNVNISAPTIIMTLAIADSIHLFNTFFSGCSRKLSKHDALVESLRLNFYPILLTSVTTAFGFLTMNFSESPPFKELGTISAIGVLGAFWATIFMLPGLIMILPFNPERKETKINLFTNNLATFVIKNHNSILFGSLAIIVLALASLPRVELNDNPIGYFSKNTPVRQASEFIEKNLSGTQTIHYSIDSGVPDGILEPVLLQQVETFTNWLRSQPEVANVESFTDVMKRFNQILHDDNPDLYYIPKTRPLAAQYFLLYELSLPYGLDISNQVSTDKSSLKITAILNNQNSSGLIEFEEKVQNWFMQEMPDLAAPGAGHSVSFAHIGQRNIESMLFGSLIAIVLISFSLIITFRSFKYGLLSFVPNLLPAMVTLGMWGAVVGEVNMAASVVFSLTLGIIVDDTVHFMVKYIHAIREEKADVETAIRYAFTSVGGALLSTSIVLAVGFYVLAFSDFTVNSTSGKLVAITITTAILLDLLFFPSLLIKLERMRAQKRG